MLAALRALPRPSTVKKCDACGDPVVTNYPQCRACHDALDQHWLADWHALLARESVAAGSDDEKLLARVVLEEAEQHPFSCVDIAMTLLVCGECGRECGASYPKCAECSLAFGWAMGSEQAAGQKGLVTLNEHALHVGRMVLRFQENHSHVVRTGWRLNLPRMLTGWMPSTEDGQRGARLIREGREQELIEEMQRVDEEIAARAALTRAT